MKVSESIEKYLKALFNHHEQAEIAKTTELAQDLKVSPSSVTEIIKKLADQGIVGYQPRKGAILTGKGMALAQRIVRKHRLLECLLHNILGLKRERVHEEADKLDHGLSDEASAALCKFLNNPKTCADDEKPIPPCLLNVSDCRECAEKREKDGEGSKLVTQLSNLKPDEEGVIAFIRGGRKACQRLLDMGLTYGTRVRVVNAAPFHGPVELMVRGTRLALGRGLAEYVYLEMDEDTPTAKALISTSQRR